MLTQLFKTIILAGFFIGTTAFSFALDHNHDHDHDQFPEGTLQAYEGQDAITGKECLLFITDVGYTGPEHTPAQWYATVLTSYRHDGDGAAPFTVKLHANKPGVLVGAGSNGQDLIALFLDPQDLNLNNLQSFNLKWLHGDHFHTNRCINLQAHQD